MDQEKATAAAKARNERLAQMTDTERAQALIQSKLSPLTRQLLDAALGRKDFASLDPKERLAATIRALEWGIGRPIPMSPVKPPESEESLVIE